MENTVGSKKSNGQDTEETERIEEKEEKNQLKQNVWNGGIPG